MRRYYRVLLVWLLLVASVTWGFPLAWQQVLSEFQQYKKLTEYGRGESVKNSLVYQVRADKWVVFSIPANTEQLRIISNLNIKPSIIQQATPQELEPRWQYALHYQVLDRQNHVLSEQTHYHGTRLTRYQDEQGQQFYTNYYDNNNLIPLDGRLAILSLKSLPAAEKIQLKLETFESQAVDAVIRLYVPTKVAEHRIGTLWLRMNDKQKQALAKGSVYPAALLNENEKLNLLRHQWSPLGPQGVVDRDYQARTLYALNDVDYKEVGRQALSTGLVVGAQQPIVIPVVGSGSRLLLDLKPVDQTTHGDVVITLHWFGTGLKARWQKQMLWHGAGTPLELTVQPGLLEVHSAKPLLLKVFSQEHLGAEKIDITPQLVNTYAYYADSGLDYKIRHINHQPAMVRIDVRRLISSTDANLPATVRYQWLDAQHQILQQGELIALETSSVYDRVKNAVDNVQISDPKRYYFKLPNAVKYLRISALQHDVLVSLYNQPIGLVKHIAIPKWMSMANKMQGSDLPSWFVMKPEHPQSLVLNKLLQAISIQPRPPIDDPYLAEGLYLWEDYLPERRVEARYILVPYEGQARRKEILSNLYCVLPVNQSFKARLQAYGSLRTLNPELIFIRPNNQAFDFSISQNQRVWAQATAKGKQGVYYLPDIKTGVHTLKLQSSEPITWLINTMNNCQGAQYLKRRAFKLNSRHKLVFNVQHQDGVNETLSAKIFASASGTQHSKIKVSIMPLKGNAPASYKAYSDWTFTQRVYDISHQQEANSWVLFTNAQDINAGESFFIPLNSDLPAGPYRIEMSLQEGEVGFVSLSKLTPGIHAQRHFYSKTIN